MSYVDANLLEGERMLYRTRLHWKVFVPPILFALVMSVPVAWIALAGTWSAFAWIPPALAALWLIAAFVKRQTSEFVVTNKRVLMKIGVFTVRSIELLLSKVEAITVHQSLVGRMLGYGDIVLVQRSEPAALKGENNTELNGLNLVTLSAEWKRNGVAQTRKIQFYLYRNG